MKTKNIWMGSGRHDPVLRDVLCKRCLASVSAEKLPTVLPANVGLFLSLYTDSNFTCCASCDCTQCSRLPHQGVELSVELNTRDFEPEKRYAHHLLSSLLRRKSCQNLAASKYDASTSCEAGGELDLCTSRSGGFLVMSGALLASDTHMSDAPARISDSRIPHSLNAQLSPLFCHSSKASFIKQSWCLPGLASLERQQTYLKKF